MARYVLSYLDGVLTAHDDGFTDEINPCNHEEADTRMLLHVAHATAQGHQKASIRTVDTDVIVLAVSHFQHLQLTEL